MGVIVKIAFLGFMEILRAGMHRHVDPVLVWDKRIISEFVVFAIYIEFLFVFQRKTLEHLI